MSRKPIKEILVDIHDDEFCYLTAFEALDEEKRNALLRGFYLASSQHSASSALLTANDLRSDLDAAMEAEAQRIYELPRSPLFVAFDEINSGFPSIERTAA